MNLPLCFQRPLYWVGVAATGVIGGLLGNWLHWIGLPVALAVGLGYGVWAGFYWRRDKVRQP